MPRLLETARQYTPRCYPTARLPSSPSSVPMYVCDACVRESPSGLASGRVCVGRRHERARPRRE